MAKITIPALLKRGLIVPDVSKNPEYCLVSEAKIRIYLTGGKIYKSGSPVGVRVERQGSWRVVESGQIISRYVLPAGTYRYKCEGVLFLTSLEEALVQAGFDIYNYPD